MKSKTTISGISIDLVKRGRRTYGAIYTLPDGRQAYLAYRKTKEIFRSGEKTISDAIRKGIACWAIDEETLLIMRAKGIKYIGVLCRDTGDKYLTALSLFFDPKAIRIYNYESRGGALQRYLPLQRFRRRTGSVSV